MESTPTMQPGPAPELDDIRTIFEETERKYTRLTGSSYTHNREKSLELLRHLDIRYSRIVDGCNGLFSAGTLDPEGFRIRAIATERLWQCADSKVTDDEVVETYLDAIVAVLPPAARRLWTELIDYLYCQKIRPFTGEPDFNLTDPGRQNGDLKKYLDLYILFLSPVVNTHPNLVDFVAPLVETLRYNNEFESALRVLERAERNGLRDEWVVYQKILTYEASGDFDKARNLIMTEIESHPDTFEPYDMMASFLERRATSCTDPEETKRLRNEAVEYYHKTLERTENKYHLLSTYQELERMYFNLQLPAKAFECGLMAKCIKVDWESRISMFAQNQAKDAESPSLKTDVETFVSGGGEEMSCKPMETTPLASPCDN